jgi:hypothetical protein
LQEHHELGTQEPSRGFLSFGDLLPRVDPIPIIVIPKDIFSSLKKKKTRLWSFVIWHFKEKASSYHLCPVSLQVS